MYEAKFSRWQSWGARNDLKNIDLPGVYALALSRTELTRKRFSWRRNIIYIGMTNASLKSRLKQFDNTIVGKTGHGGADRVRYQFQNYKRLVKRLYVAVAPTRCDPRSNRPADLRRMGSVTRLEYFCLAEYVERFGILPQFNNKQKAPKYSLTFGRLAR